jgi:hypothetical protein
MSKEPASLPSTVEKKDGDVTFQGVTSLYDFFSPRTKKIENWSFGFRNGGVEVDIAESTGSKIKIFDARPESKEKYAIFERIMDTHETEKGDPAWAEVLTDHWILPGSTMFSSILPSQHAGTIDISGVSTQLRAIEAEEIPRIDICKVDYDDYTCNIVYNILHLGYRPGIFLVNWPNHPDCSNETMACAGHLQTCGYRLLNSSVNYFTYMFIDECMYEICSWNCKDTPNPMFQEFLKNMRELARQSIQMQKNAQEKEESVSASYDSRLAQACENVSSLVSENKQSNY